MSNNPINLAARFLLELYALYAMGYWAFHKFSGWAGIILMILIPLIAAVVWGAFRPPAESPAGHAVIPIPGWLRLLIEVGFFGFAVWCLFNAGANLAGSVFSAALMLHYFLSFDRIGVLLGRSR